MINQSILTFIPMHCNTLQLLFYCVKIIALPSKLYKKIPTQKQLWEDKPSYGLQNNRRIYHLSKLKDMIKDPLN